MDKNEIKKMADLIEKITFVINCIELKSTLCGWYIYKLKFNELSSAS